MPDEYRTPGGLYVSGNPRALGEVAPSPVRIDLMGEVGTEGTLTWGGRSQDRYHADLQGPDGIERLAQSLRREPACYVTNQIILLTARSSEWTVAPGGETAPDRAAAEFVQSCLYDMSRDWWQAVKFALSALAFGFADLEIVYKRRLGRHPPQNLPGSAYDDGLIGLRKLAPRRQETVDHWAQDEHGGYQWLIQRHPETAEELYIPIEKLLHFVGGDDRGGWEGLGWLEPAYKLVHLIDAYEIIEGVGHQRSFVGLPVFEFEGELGSALHQYVQRLGRGLVVNAHQYVTIPKQLGFRLETVSNTNASELREKINQLRWDIQSLALVSFLRLGSTETGAYSLGESLKDVFAKSINGALDSVADVVNRHLVPRLLAANPRFAPATYPTVQHAAVDELPLEVLQYLTGVQDWLDRARPEDAQWLRAALGLPPVALKQLETEQAERRKRTEEAAKRADEAARRREEQDAEAEEEDPEAEAEAAARAVVNRLYGLGERAS